MPGKHYTEEEFKDIVRLHGVDGKSFEEIIPILKEKYGQDRTVRALNVIYTDRKNKYEDIQVVEQPKKERAPRKSKKVSAPVGEDQIGEAPETTSVQEEAA